MERDREEVGQSGVPRTTVIGGFRGRGLRRGSGFAGGFECRHGGIEAVTRREELESGEETGSLSGKHGEGNVLKRVRPRNWLPRSA